MIPDPAPFLILANQIFQRWDINKLYGQEPGARGQRSGHRRRSLCHHVLLPLVESDLAERDGAHHHVDGSGDEAVDADLVVETVDVLRGIFTAGKKKEKTSLSAVCHRSDWPCFLWFAVASMTRRSVSSSGRTDRAAFNPQLTRYGCHPRWTGRLRSARLTWHWRRFPTSPAREQDTGSTWGSGTRQGHSYESNLVTEFKCFLFTASTEDLFW